MLIKAFDKLLKYKRHAERVDALRDADHNSWLAWLFRNELTQTKWPI